MSDVNIIITVKNLASKEIDKTKKDLKDLGSTVKATAQTTATAERAAATETKRSQKERQQSIQDTINSLKSLDFLYKGSIARGLIGTAGLIGAFKLGEASAEADRLRASFDQTFGPGSGGLLALVKKSTGGMVDEIEIMRGSLKTAIAGVRDLKVIPEIFRLGAIASQRLGIEAPRAMDLMREAVVEFNEGAMEQLGLITKLDPRYKIQLQLLERSTKGLSAFAATQLKLNYVMQKMRERFGENFTLVLDHQLAIDALTSSFTNFRNTASGLINDALVPFYRGIAEALDTTKEFLFLLRNDKSFMEGAKSALKFVAALSAVVAGMTALKLSIWAITSVFSGPFGILGGLAGLAIAMKIAKSSNESLIDTFKRWVNIGTGVFELVTSFFTLGKGVGQVNENLAKLLGPEGLKIAVDIAQSAIKVVNFLEGFGDGLYVVLIKPLEYALKVFGLISETGEQSFEKWQTIGKVVGVLVGGFTALLSILSLIGAAIGAISSGIAALGTIAASLPVLGSLISTAAPPLLAGGAVAAGAIGGGILGRKTGEALIESGMLKGNLNAQSLPPKILPSPAVNVNVPNAALINVMSQAVHYLKSLDEKSRPQSVVEKNFFKDGTPDR